MRAATSQSYEPGLLARAWARSAALRLAPPPGPPAPTPATPDPPQWTDEQLEAARRDPAAFNAFVLRDEQGEPITNADHHLAMQAACTAHPRCAIRGFAESAKTTAIAVGRVLFELGHNPNLRAGILCESTEKAKELVSLIAQYVSESEELHAVFPSLRPARRDADPLKKLKGRAVKWSMASFTVERSARLRDPSVRATGYGKPVQGVRFDLLIVDDLITWMTSLTKRARTKLERWFRNAIAGRLTNQSRVWLLNTAYHPQDLGRTLVTKDAYVEVRIPARDPQTGASRWPAKWSDEQLARRVRDLGGEGSVEVARQVDAQDRDEASTSFQDGWVKRALARGAELELIERWPADVELPHGAFFVAGVDIAVGEKESSAESAIVVLLCYPYGDPDAGLLPGTYQLAWIEAGRWDGPALLERIYDVSERFGRCPVFVETVAIQMWALQFKIPNRAPPPLYPFQTGRNKWHPVWGVASIGIDMNSGLVIIPNDDGVCVGQVASLIEELKTFSPGEHTGDRHMAFWIAREGMRHLADGGGGNVDVRG